MLTHQVIDERSRRLAVEVAAKLRVDPALLAIGRRNIERWRLSCSASTLPGLLEWERLIGEGLDAVCAALVEEGERGQRRRGYQPFAGVLTPAERTEAMRRIWSELR